jgi:hypothetical protein
MDGKSGNWSSGGGRLGAGSGSMSRYCIGKKEIPVNPAIQKGKDMLSCVGPACTS